jgi:hypothetical protein
MSILNCDNTSFPVSSRAARSRREPAARTIQPPGRTPRDAGSDRGGPFRFGIHGARRYSDGRCGLFLADRGLDGMTMSLPRLAVCPALLAALAASAGCGDSRVPGAPAAEASAPPPRAKADPPIDLDLHIDAPDAGGLARIRVDVSSRVDLDRCEVDVRLPDGVAVAAGRPAWRGALARGRRQALELAVRVPDGRRYEITAAARARFEDGTVAARTVSRAVNAAAEKPAAPAGEMKTNSRGESILELPAGPPR